MSVRPIIAAHGFGGLFTQILLSLGYGCVGIGISPAQPAGLKPSGLPEYRNFFV